MRAFFCNIQTGALEETTLDDENPLQDARTRFIHGYIELVGVWAMIDNQLKPCHLLVDEDGRSKDLPINQPATIIAYGRSGRLSGSFSNIVGPAVLLDGELK